MPATDRYHGRVDAAMSAPYVRAEAVTPSDGAELAEISRALYIGGAGHVAVVTSGGDAVTFSAVPVGTILPVRVRQVKATGTTATNILALA
jgi:hypothetical protein